MAQEDFYDIVIIGGGPGGLSAAIYAMRAALKTVLVERMATGGQVNMSDEVENYPGFQHVSGAELSLKFSEHALSYGLEIIAETAEAVLPGLEHHAVRLADGRVLNAHAVILAPGGSPRKLNVPGEEENYGKGVSYCAVCDGFFFRNKTVMVVGGGDSAAEEALYLAKLADKVYLVHRRDALRASMILQQRVKEECKIEIKWNSVINRIEADGDGVRSARLQDTQTGAQESIAVDGVFVFIGFKPNNALVPAGIRMSADGFVVTNEKCETNTPGIYVVGDLREHYARQIVIAAADGCLAALAAAHYVETRKSSAVCETPAAFLK